MESAIVFREGLYLFRYFVSSRVTFASVEFTKCVWPNPQNGELFANISTFCFDFKEIFEKLKNRELSNKQNQRPT